jgi:hypothetical protein
MSYSLALGNIVIVTPSLTAAITFSLTPPIASTFPLRVISPVIATFYGTDKSRARLIIDVVIAIPADGPSFFTAPSGK